MRVEFRKDSDATRRDKLTLGIRPEKVRLREEPGNEQENCFPVTVKELQYIGSETHYLLDCSGLQLSAEVMNSKVGSQGFEAGQKAFVYLPPAGLVVLDD